MARKKTKLGWFTVPEWKKEEEWLRKQHKKGWKLIKASVPCFYKFEECQPEDVIYQLDYNQEGMDHKGEYIQMFQDCGWEYVTDMMGYAYFRKPASEMSQEKEEIFCDEESRLEMMDRVYKGRMIPLIVIFCGVIVPQIVLQSQNDSIPGRMLLTAFVLMFVLYLTVFLKFAREYHKIKRGKN